VFLVSGQQIVHRRATTMTWAVMANRGEPLVSAGVDSESIDSMLMPCDERW
jgi:hypothetical protein